MIKYMTFIALFSLVLVGSSSASLVMEINTGAKTFNITGSASGQFQHIGDYYAVWEFGDTSSGNPADELNLSAAFDQTMSLNSSMAFYTSGGQDLFLGNNSNVTFLSGTGTDISYSGLSASLQSRLEGMIDSTMPLTVGSGFNSMSVIPEPSTIMMSLSVGGVMFLIRRIFLI